MLQKISAVFIVCLLFSTGLLTAQDIRLTVECSHPDGLYNSAEDREIRFIVRARDKDGRELPEMPKLEYSIAQEGECRGEARAILRDVRPTEDRQIFSFPAPASLEKDRRTIAVPMGKTPGWTLLSVTPTDEQGKKIGRTVLCGALADREKIRAGAPDPADFDAFWQGELKKMRALPLKPELEEVKVTDAKFAGKVRAWKFKLDCGGGNFAYGFIAMPAHAKPGSLPAILQTFGAGCFGVRAPGLYYALHNIHVVLSPHPTEAGMPNEYYTKFRAANQGYARQDAGDRDRYYMKFMILRVLRTLEFIKSRPEWNGKDLVTHGESQGGFQALAGAALDPEVSFCLAMVPAMSDHLGYKMQRRSGWPQVVRFDKMSVQNAGPEVEAALPYFDNVNFARRIHCPIWLSTGLIDTTCPPSGVLAVYNNLPEKTEKHLYIAPDKGHDAGNPSVVETLHKLIAPPDR